MSNTSTTTWAAAPNIPWPICPIPPYRACLLYTSYGEMDVLRIFDNPSLGSYYKFLEKYEKYYHVRLSDREEKVIDCVSKKLASGKRIHELVLLNRMLSYNHRVIGSLKRSLNEEYGIMLKEKSAESVVNVMTNKFPAGFGKKTYADCIFLEKEDQGNDYKISKSFEVMLENPEFYAILKELVEFGTVSYTHLDVYKRQT